LGLTADIDPRTVWLGGLLGAALVLPPIYVAQAVGDGNAGQDSALWVVPVVAIFVAFPVTGFWSARRQPATPLMHAALAGAVAGVAMMSGSIAVRVARGEAGLAAVVAALLVLQIAISLSLAGAWWAGRRKERVQ
jgi:predicted permease